jgi:hypothetical protein
LFIVPAGASGFRWDSFFNVWRAIFGLKREVRELQSQIQPGFDSGWIDAGLGVEDIILSHNLGTRDLRVYIYYRMEDPGIPSADFKQTHNIRASEPYWEAYDYNEIAIRFPTTDYVWQEIRVLIWAIPD